MRARACPCPRSWYYVNNDTRKTQWEWPDDVPKPELNVEDIRFAKDPTSGKIYYAEGETTTWDVPASIVAAHVAGLSEPASPKPGPASAKAAAKPAQPAASGAGGAPAAPSTDSSPFGFSAQMKSAWMDMLSSAKAEAESAIAVRNNKFGRLQQFKIKQAQRREKEQERKALEAKAEAAEAEEDKVLQALEAKRTMMDLLEVECPPAPTESKSMEEYASSYLQLNRKGLFRSATTVDKLLTFKNSLISMALHDFGAAASDLTSTATQMWKNVLGFIGERSSGKDTDGHAEKIVKVALHAPEGELPSSPRTAPTP